MSNVSIYDRNAAQHRLPTVPAITMAIYTARPEAVNQSGILRRDQNNTAGKVCETGSDPLRHFCTGVSALGCKRPAVAGSDE